MLGRELLRASRRRNVDEALDLLNRGAATTSRDQYGNTPLHWAVHYGSFALINALLEKNADLLCALSKDGRTPVDLASQCLFKAIQRNHTADALAWMNSIALLTWEDSEESTCLHWAVRNGNFVLINALLEKGADAASLDHDFKTPIDIASRNLLFAVRNNATADALAWINSIALTTAMDEYANRYYSPLHWAAYHNNLALITALIDKGANMEGGDCDGKPPKLSEDVLEKVRHLSSLKERLFDAVKHAVNENDEHTRVALDYLNQGVISSCRQLDTGYTPLHWAAINNNMILFERIKSGSNMMVKDADGVTPQGILASRRKLEMLSVLLGLPKEMLEIIGEYYGYAEGSQNCISFVFQDTQRVAGLFAYLKAPLKLTALDKFKQDLESTALLTVPKMASKLNLFLAEDKDMAAQLILPLDGFIKELAKDINLNVCLAIANYLQNRKSILSKLVRDFKELYQMMRSTDQRFHIGKGFLRGKENFCDEYFLEKVAAYIHANTQSQTATCWEIVCKYENRNDQVKELKKVMSGFAGLLTQVVKLADQWADLEPGEENKENARSICKKELDHLHDKMVKGALLKERVEYQIRVMEERVSLAKKYKTKKIDAYNNRLSAGFFPPKPVDDSAQRAPQGNEGQPVYPVVQQCRYPFN